MILLDSTVRVLSLPGWTAADDPPRKFFNIFTGEQAGGKTAIEQQGKMIVAENTSDPSEPFYENFEGTSMDRSVLLGDSVHYIHDTSVWSASWGSGADMTDKQ